MARASVTRCSVAVGLALVVSGCTSSHPRSSSASADVSQLPATPTAPAASGSPTPASPGASASQILASPSRPPSTSSVSPAETPVGDVPRFAHIVVVVLENHPYGELIGTSSTPFLTSLAAAGAVLTQSYAITHPSEPNYLALFSGSTQGLSDDSCPHTFTGPNLGGQLLAAHLSFTGYSEDLPSAGATDCTAPWWNFIAPPYARKHAPWVNFTDVPASSNQPFISFPSDYS